VAFHALAPLVLDSDEPEARRFRHDPDLGVSGSAQFSLAGWQDIRERIGTPLGGALYVADLREECHGFVGDAAVSWYGTQNAECVDIGDEAADDLERRRLDGLTGAAAVFLANAEDVKRGRSLRYRRRAGGDVRDERAALGLPRGHYLRWRITDHRRPTIQVVEELVAWARAHLGRAHLHVHCRGGRGRTALVSTLLDILAHARDTALETILARQHQLSGYDLLRTTTPSAADAPHIAERRRFVSSFFTYARSVHDVRSDVRHDVRPDVRSDGQRLGFGEWLRRCSGAASWPPRAQSC
jgi:Inositol hexakisphosphate